MKQPAFDTYEYIGIITPGAVLLTVLMLLFPEMRSQMGQKELSWGPRDLPDSFFRARQCCAIAWVCGGVAGKEAVRRQCIGAFARSGVHNYQS